MYILQLALKFDFFFHMSCTFSQSQTQKSHEIDHFESPENYTYTVKKKQSFICSEQTMVEFSAKSVIILVDWFLGSSSDVFEKIRPFLELFKFWFIVPLLKVCLYICFVMSFMLSVEWFLMMSLAIMAKLFWKKPEERYIWEPIKDDPEIGSAAFPMVLVQIPVFNEAEVYKISISAACNLSWPVDRLVIQVLDDSTDFFIRDMIEKECIKWKDAGIDIWYEMRETRDGYKAGALRDGLKHHYVKECDYVAIFDADFQPDPDFLRHSVPYFVHNAELALVQARWTFVNADECFLTRVQEIPLDFQFCVGDEGESSLLGFFSFRGSAGIWRVAAINEAGGWKDRTTVEDMDLAIRASLKGWKFVYLGNLKVKSELPSTFEAYRSQQHRWSSGIANLFRKIAMDIAKNKEVSPWMKIYMIYDFFFVRRILTNMCAFFFYCIVMPLATVIPEIDHMNKSKAILITFIMATINTIFTTPRSFYLAIPWFLFENVMSFHRTKATFIGLLETKRANEWIVTKKHGDTLQNNSYVEFNILEKPSRLKLLGDRILLQELGIAVFLLACGCYGFFCRHDYYSIYLFLQAIFFTIAGFGYFGTIVSTS